MSNSLKDILYIISRNSDIDEKTLTQALEEKVYPDKNNWKKYTRLFFLSASALLFVSGVIFFFAFNWQSLHKFLKLGLIQGSIIAGIIILFKVKSNIFVQNITLTVVSMLVGVLFAVFGQIYQTGANSYDFFLGWTVFISVWVISSNFNILWLIYSILLNITLFFYFQQIAPSWLDSYYSISFLVLNSCILTILNLLSKYKTKFILSNWLNYTLATIITLCTTVTLMFLSDFNIDNSIRSAILIVTLLVYILGLLKARSEKSIVYIALIAISLIITSIKYIFIGLESMDQTLNLLICTLFCILSFGLSISNLSKLKKQWENEN